MAKVRAAFTPKRKRIQRVPPAFVPSTASVTENQTSFRKQEEHFTYYDEFFSIVESIDWEGAADLFSIEEPIEKKPKRTPIDSFTEQIISNDTEDLRHRVIQQILQKLLEKVDPFSIVPSVVYGWPIKVPFGSQDLWSLDDLLRIEQAMPNIRFELMN